MGAAGIFIRGTASVIALCACSLAAHALDRVSFAVSGGDDGLESALRAASRVLAAQDSGQTDGPDVLGAALSDYRNLVEALYAAGHYSVGVSIRIDGREAAEMALLNVPDQVGTVAIAVDPGPVFRFGTVTIAPQAPGGGDATPKPGEVAESGRIRDAVLANIDSWRDQGFATAKPKSERVVADHPNARLDVAVGIDPGPRARLGALLVTTPSAVREDRIKRIAGLPTGEVFSPQTLRTVATRLRRTGAFTSVNLAEASELGPGDTLDVALTVADAKPRRFGFGAELSSLEGLELSSFWLHRNLLGGAERLRFDASVSNIGGTTSGIDYFAGGRFEIPALFGADTSGFVAASYEHLDEPSYRSDAASIGVGVGRIFSDELQADIGLNFEYSETSDGLGDRQFTLATAPVSATWDLRDDPLDATAGTFLAGDFTPFFGLDGTASGLRSAVDARAYRSVGEADRVVLAGRLQFGSVVGAAQSEVRPDFLFFSGGGGTVRGQPYQSLNADMGSGTEIGGRSFLGLSAEVRTKINDQFGAVIFADAGYIGSEAVFDGGGAWHAGAGLGVRYQTGLGPIRFDVAGPVAGDTGSGPQVYIGIGQAF